MVQPTIDLPLVSNLNNNSIEQQFYNDTDTEMVTLKIIEVYENDKEPSSWWIYAFCRLIIMIQS